MGSDSPDGLAGLATDLGVPTVLTYRSSSAAKSRFWDGGGVVLLVVLTGVVLGAYTTPDEGLWVLLGETY